MNLPEFSGSPIGKDLLNIIDEIKKIIEMMQVTVNDRVVLVSYQFKDVAQIWFT